MCLRSCFRFTVLSVLSLLVALPPAGAHAGEVKIEINAARPGAAIDPLVYSEFIEHLGRCIYGGIWAEMLRDRKFLLPLKDSSWKVVEPSADFEAKADAAGAFAGVPCMALWLRKADGKAHGIRQGGLGVVREGRYAAAIWIASAGDPATVSVGLGSWMGIEISRPSESPPIFARKARLAFPS